MTDADFITAGGHVDQAVDRIARLVEQHEGLLPNDADARIMAAAAAMSLILDSAYREAGYSAVKILMNAMARAEADLLTEARRPDPRNAFDLAH